MKNINLKMIQEAAEAFLNYNITIRKIDNLLEEQIENDKQRRIKNG